MLKMKILLKIIETFKEPKNMPSILSKPLSPIAEINFEKIEPNSFNKIKDVRNKIMKLIKFLIGTELLISLT